MTKNEIQVLRANLLGGMDTYIREVVVDEEYLMSWLAYGVPDEASEEDLMEIAEDEEEFNRIAEVFGSIINNLFEDYGTEKD